MNIPKVVSDLIEAQNNSDSKAFSELFSETAVVKDEGYTYEGKDAVKKWIEAANEKYAPQIKPVKVEHEESKIIVSMEASGNFGGSPIVLKYYFGLEEEQITDLEIL